MADPHFFEVPCRLGFRVEALVEVRLRVGVRHVAVMAEVRFSGERMHNVNEDPYKCRSTNVRVRFVVCRRFILIGELKQ